MTQTPAPMPKRPGMGLLFAVFTTVGLLTLAAVSVLAWYQWRYNDKVYPGVERGRRAARRTDRGPGRVRGYRRADPVSGRGNHVALRRQVVDPHARHARSLGRRQHDGRAGLRGWPARSGRERKRCAGRHAGWAQQDALDQIRALTEGVALEPILQYDGDQQAAVVRRIAEAVDLAPVEGAITITDADVTGTPGRLGRAMDAETTRQALAHWSNRGPAA